MPETTATDRPTLRSGAALVTGGSRGIGLAVAEALAKAGHPIALTARGARDLETASARLLKAGAPAVVTVAADLGDPAAASQIVERASLAVGRIEILVNCAGTAPTAKLDRTTDAMLDEVFNLHVKAPFRLLRELLPQWRESDRGCLIQVGSTAGLRGFAFTSAYTAAKHAMVGMTRALVAELGEASRIACYVVCPGFVDTDITRSAAAGIAARDGGPTAEEAMASMAAMNRIGRMHRPEEIGAAVAMLVNNRPKPGVVFDLDRDPAAFV